MNLRIKRPADGHIVVTPQSAGWGHVGAWRVAGCVRRMWR